jgi:hypothetical protein
MIYPTEVHNPVLVGITMIVFGIAAVIYFGNKLIKGLKK